MIQEMTMAEQDRLKSVQKGGGKGISFEIAVVRISEKPRLCISNL